jgi:hypothetical protein
MQPAEQIAHRLAGLRHGFGALDGWAKIVMCGLPIHATELRVPMGVAHGLPDTLEGVDVELLLSWGELGGGEGWEEEK